MSEGFADRAFTLPVCASGNIIALAATGEPIDLSLVELASRARRLKRDTGLNLLPMVSRLVQMQVPNSDRFEL
jgi:spermidine synthase